MTISRRLERLRQLDWGQRLLLADAVVSLAIASLAIKLFPFSRAVKLGAHRLGRARFADELRLAGALRWSVEAAARRLPWRTVCFQKGVALQSMLRRRGIDARLHYGIGKDEDGELCAHVWVSAGNEMLIGSDEAPRFRAVANYPS